VFNNALYFSANAGGLHPNYELWKHDGITTSLAANIHPDSGTNYASYPNGLTVFNGGLYFMADDGANGYELWKHDGTSAKLFANINPGGPDSSSYPKHFTAVGTQLFFEAFNSTSGFELWKTDGASVGLAADINPGSASSYPEVLTEFNGALYFRATDGARGYELWKHDGAQASLVADINPAGDSFPSNLTVFGSQLVFTADDGVHGWELWRYDGTKAEIVADLNSSGDAFPENLTVYNGALYFTATTPEAGYEVWKYDGTNVTLAADVAPGANSSYPKFLFPFKQELLFSATDDSFSNWELWRLPISSASNLPPTVSITSPANAAQFSAADSITITASATDDGSVSKVEFFSDGNLIGAATTQPFSISVSLAAGAHTLTAKATDNLGATATSAGVTITVSATPAEQPRFSSIRVSGAREIQITASTGSTAPHVLQGTPDFKEWTNITTNTPVAGTLTFTDKPAGTLRFYRILIP